MKKKNFQLNPRQCRRIYEIVRLLYTNIHDDKDYTAYRLDVKRRLNNKYYKKLRDVQRFERVMAGPKGNSPSILTTEERHKLLDEDYKTIETDYLSIVEKLKNIKD